jgi:hypothetical protein
MLTVCEAVEERFSIKMRNNADTADVTKKAFGLRPGALRSCAWKIDLDAADLVTNGAGINSAFYAGWTSVYDAYRVVAVSARIVYRHNDLENEGMIHVGMSSAVLNTSSYIQDGSALTASTPFLVRASAPARESRYLVLRPRDVSHRIYRRMDTAAEEDVTDWGTWTILLDGCKTGATICEVILNRTIELCPKVAVTAGAAGDEEVANYEVLHAISEGYSALPHGVSTTSHDPAPMVTETALRSLGKSKFSRGEMFKHAGQLSNTVYNGARFAGRVADAVDAWQMLG